MPTTKEQEQEQKYKREERNDTPCTELSSGQRACASPQKPDEVQTSNEKKTW
jgi:hypothetical protein